MSETQTPVVLKRRSAAEQYLDRCIHFTGVQHDVCAVGVRYEDVRVRHLPIAYQRDSTVYRRSDSLPCNASMNLGGATCEKRCLPTPEQAAEHEAASKREIEFFFTSVARIQEATKGERGVSGSIECPKCSQPFHYSVAGSNGHVHARCSTQGCIAWMQ